MTEPDPPVPAPSDEAKALLASALRDWSEARAERLLTAAYAIDLPRLLAEARAEAARPTHICLGCGALGYAGGYHDHGGGEAGDTCLIEDLRMSYIGIVERWQIEAEDRVAEARAEGEAAARREFENRCNCRVECGDVDDEVGVCKWPEQWPANRDSWQARLKREGRAEGEAAPFIDHARTAHAAAQTTYGDVCRWCGHKHDPEDGRCDAHAHVGPGACPCPGEGLAVAYDKINAALYVAEQDYAELRGELERVRAETEAARTAEIVAPFAGCGDGSLDHPWNTGALIEATKRLRAAHFNPETEHSEHGPD